MGLLPVEDARARILAGATPLPAERVALAAAHGRVLAAPVIARRTQPSFAGSAMDGYAVRSADLGPRRVIGESAAGRRFAGRVGEGEAVRIFTGAPLPEGADAVVAQEEVKRDGDIALISNAPAPGRYVRAAGIDFAAGDALLPAGMRLGPRELALAAAANLGEVAVHRAPRVAVVSIGDELVLPGGEPGPDQTVATNAFAVAALAREAGATVADYGIVPDREAEVTAAATRAAGEADILVTIGGASVGDHDVAKGGLAAAGMALDFWKIAMRPGKPLAFGRIGPLFVLGLPGNPVSAYVCALMFLTPLIAALSGEPPRDATQQAILGADLPANGERAAYLRGVRLTRSDGVAVVTPLPSQDSSLLRTLASADCLLVRPVDAPPARAGDVCTIIPLDAAR
ncbi:MAG: molybdopterin molybdotransferase MoeA [Bauldia sp.]|nr:molybdopterin molybdotransferase MoeA [Bauldia sp.]